MAPAKATPLQTPPDPALEQIYREHARFVWRSLRRLGVPEATLEDAMQDVFVVAARRLSTFEGRSSVRTWLFGIAMRVQRGRRRSRARHDRKLGALQNEPTPRPADDFARTDAQRTLTRMLGELDEDKRAVFVLVELEGESAVEVAEAFGANVNTIYTRLRAARKALRAMAQQWAEAEES